MNGSLAALVFMALPATGAAPWSGEAQIQFHATSTLKDFSGTATAEPVVLMLGGLPESPILHGTATVAVARMDTRHAQRDKNLRRMFEAERFPLVTGVIPPASIGSDGSADIPLELTIRGNTTVVPARLTGWRADNGGYRFTLDWPVSLRGAGLSPPVFMGLLRVGDTVRVQVQFRLSPPEPE
jgi:hypothetical protein